MTRRPHLLVMTLAAAALLCGCAGLMMNVKDLDEEHAKLSLKSGESVAIDEAMLESSFKKANADSDAKKLASQLKQELSAKLVEKGVTVDPSSEQKLTVEITRYDRGCGFCRGFFPVFGLGNTYLDGQVTLNVPAGKRVLVVEKTGQSSGTSQMGDQTDTNMGYFASVVASKLADSEAETKQD